MFCQESYPAVKPETITDEREHHIIDVLSGNSEIMTQINSISSNCDTNESENRIQTLEIGEYDNENRRKPVDHSDGHPTASHPTNYMETLLHLFKGNLGSGLLAMGAAFKNGGIVFATISIFLLGIICVHAQHQLLNYSEALQSKLKLMNPPEFAETVSLAFAHGPIRMRPFARTMRILVIVFLCITQLGFCCVYIVFISENVKMICDQYKFEIELSVHMVIVIIPILLSCMVRELKYLTPFSSVANIFMVVGVGFILYEATQDIPPVESRAYIASWKTLPLFLGTAVYAFEGIGLVLPLKNEMKQPEQFQKPLGVLNVGMVVVGMIFTAVGLLGYLKWGNNVSGSLTLNLKPDQILSNVVQGLIVLAMLFTYPLQFYVPVYTTWPIVQRRFGETSPVFKELCYRIFLVLITFVLAEIIPNLELIISLVGAISSTTLALIFPPLIELVFISQTPEGITIPTIVKDVFIILLGIFIFVTGTLESIWSIVRAFKA